MSAVVSRHIGVIRACRRCGGEFAVTSITGRHYFCSESCKEKDVWQRERQRPEVVLASRERSRSWAAANRSVNTLP